MTSTWTPDFFSYSAPISTRAFWISALELSKVMVVPLRDGSYSKVSTEVSMGSFTSTSLGSSGSLAKPKRHPATADVIRAASTPTAISLVKRVFFMITPPAPQKVEKMAMKPVTLTIY